MYIYIFTKVSFFVFRLTYNVFRITQLCTNTASRMQTMVQHLKKRRQKQLLKLFVKALWGLSALKAPRWAHHTTTHTTQKHNTNNTKIYKIIKQIQNMQQLRILIMKIIHILNRNRCFDVVFFFREHFQFCKKTKTFLHSGFIL